MTFTTTLHRTSRRLALLLVAIVATLSIATAAAHAQTFELSYQPNAQAFWSHNGATINEVFHNGQCTQWAAERRPDILKRATEAIVSREIAHGRAENLGDWNAARWPANARAAGIPTGHSPRARALIVFQPGVLGAGSTGHIAYVSRVFANGSFEISEMHAPRLYQVTTRHLSAGDAHLDGVTFIY